MLSDDEKREIEREIAIYPNRRAACVEALKIVQRHRRWVSDDALADLASFLDMSRAELDGVATFYNLIFRRAVGRHVILACDSVSCWMLGAFALQDQLAERGIALGKIDAADRFTLLPVACLGACDGAPAIMIDDDLHVNVSRHSLDTTLERYR